MCHQAADSWRRWNSCKARHRFHQRVQYGKAKTLFHILPRHTATTPNFTFHIYRLYIFTFNPSRQRFFKDEKRFYREIHERRDLRRDFYMFCLWRLFYREILKHNQPDINLGRLRKIQHQLRRSGTAIHFKELVEALRTASLLRLCPLWTFQDIPLQLGQGKLQR